MSDSDIHLDPSLSEAQDKETALDWLKRVQKNRRHLNQNPISFNAYGLDGESDNVICEASTLSPDRFIVSPQNILNLAVKTWLSDFSNLNHIIARSRRWRQRNQINANDQDSLVALEESLLQSFPNGCGINFLDKFLSTTRNHKNIHSPKKSAEDSLDVFLELSGMCRSVLTMICTNIVASYAASTSVKCYGNSNKEISPPIVIIDPECSFSFDKLIAKIKTEVLRRWNITDSFRHHLTSKCNTLDRGHENNTWNVTENEYKNIEEDINSVLGRIQIARPRDLHGYVSILESLFQFLEMRKECHGSYSAPPMIVMASTMSAFSLTTKFQESLPDGSGLSGSSDLMRTLSRLRSNHNVLTVSTRIANVGSYNSNKSGYERYDKLVTHHISITKYLPGPNETHDEFDFVATCTSRGEAKSMLRLPFTVDL